MVTKVYLTDNGFNKTRQNQTTASPCPHLSIIYVYRRLYQPLEMILFSRKKRLKIYYFSIIFLEAGFIILYLFLMVIASLGGW